MSPSLTPPTMNSGIIINQLQAEYNGINAMNTPQVKGTPSKCNISYDRLVNNPIHNFDDYGIAYPITGQLAIPSDKLGGEGQSVAANGFYQGTDYSLGSNYYSVMGTCGPDSTPECQGKDRSVYIRNITTGSPPILGDMSLAKLTNSPNDLASNGILPTMLDNISTFLPGNLIENVFQNTGNFGGSKCQRVKLPVGAHLYDLSMKVPLDYCKINQCDENGQPPSLEVRQQRTLDQVHTWVLGVPYGGTGKPPDPTDPATVANRRSWWFEERCSPSFHYATIPNSWVSEYTPFVQSDEGESAYLPGAHPILGIGTTRTLAPLDPPTCSASCPSPADTFVGTAVVDKAATTATTATTTLQQAFRRYGCVGMAIVVLLLLVALVWVGVRGVSR